MLRLEINLNCKAKLNAAVLKKQNKQQQKTKQNKQQQQQQKTTIQLNSTNTLI